MTFVPEIAVVVVEGKMQVASERGSCDPDTEAHNSAKVAATPKLRYRVGFCL